jgi:hypothetical protein
MVGPEEQLKNGEFGGQDCLRIQRQGRMTSEAHHHRGWFTQRPFRKVIDYS